jgi:ABC-type Na+ transport system ATPase subunit NatA
VHLDYKITANVPGRILTWDDLFVKREGVLGGAYHFDIESIFDTFVRLYINILIFFVLAVYFDQVLGMNGGIVKNFNFFCKREKYGRGDGRKKLSGEMDETPEEFQENQNSRQLEYDDQILEGLDICDEESVRDETRSTMKIFSEKKNFQGLLVIGIGKTYRLYNNLCQVKQKIKALKNVYLSVKKDQVLSIFGINGAGKTTLTDILTGHCAPSKGKAEIFGKDLNRELSQVRKFVSVCPQFDYYWDDLTVIEHLTLFSKLRNLPSTNLTEEVQKLLELVHLEDRAHSRAHTLSGGMKRRLSIALSLIGNPQIIFFDEPTTGLDP